MILCSGEVGGCSLQIGLNFDINPFVTIIYMQKSFSILEDSPSLKVPLFKGCFRHTRFYCENCRKSTNVL